MRITLFDIQSESTKFWQDRAARSEFQFDAKMHWDGVEQVPTDSQVVILDQSVLPNTFSTVVSNLSTDRPNQVIVATGGHLSVKDVVQVMRAGVDYVFEKPLNPTLLDAVLPDLIRDVKKLAEKQVEFEKLKGLFESLTEREEAVLCHVLQSNSNKNAAEQLNVSVRTIETRRAKVYRKTESASVVELVRKVDRLARLSSVFDVRMNDVGCKLPVTRRKWLMYRTT